MLTDAWDSPSTWHWVDEIRLQNSLFNLQPWYSCGYLLTEKLLAFSAISHIRRLNSEHCIEKNTFWTESKINVSLKYISWGLQCKYIYLIWFGYLEVSESFSKHVLKYVTASHVTASFHCLPTYPLRQNILYKQEQTMGYWWWKNENVWSHQSQNNENKCILKLETT